MPLVDTSSRGHVGRLTLARPEARNALSAQMCDDIVSALEALSEDPAVRVLVLDGRGPVFCAGADLEAVGGEGAPAFLDSFRRMLAEVYSSRLPTIAAIHGAALGGGFQLATACDFRVAEPTAKIGIPSARLGVLVDLENVERLALLAGLSTARQMLVAGQMFSGAEAAGRGLVETAEDAGDAAAVLAEKISQLAPLSVQGAKRALVMVAEAMGGTRRKHPEAAQAYDQRVVEVFRSADLREGLAAVKEKRDPVWEGA